MTTFVCSNRGFGKKTALESHAHLKDLPPISELRRLHGPEAPFFNALSATLVDGSKELVGMEDLRFESVADMKLCSALLGYFKFETSRTQIGSRQTKLLVTKRKAISLWYYDARIMKITPGRLEIFMPRASCSAKRRLCQASVELNIPYQVFAESIDAETGDLQDITVKYKGIEYPLTPGAPFVLEVDGLYVPKVSNYTRVRTYDVELAAHETGDAFPEQCRNIKTQIEDEDAEN